MEAFSKLDQADTSAFATLGICAFATLASAPSQDKVALSVYMSACFIVWIVGVMEFASSVNTSSPERGAMIDSFLARTIAFVPLYVALIAYKNHRINISVLLGALLTGIGMGVYAVSEKAQSTQDALIAALRPLSVAVIGAVLIVVAHQAVSIASVALIESAYVVIATYTQSSEPVTLASALAYVVPASTPAPPPGACEPLCVEPGGGDAETACYQHNETVARVHERAQANGAQGLPETLGMSSLERKCLRSHARGSTCTYCQDGGCLTRSKPNTVCTRSQAETNAQFARVKAASERAVVAGTGVLSLDEQFA